MQNDLLNILYTQLEQQLILFKKKKLNESILLTFLKLSSNNASEILNKSAVPSYKITLEDRKKLINDGLIRISDSDFDSYVLTAKGLWEIEKSRNRIDDTKVIEFIHDNFMTFSAINSTLDAKEKSTLVALIATRSFSVDTAMVLDDEITMDKWLDIFQDAYNFLSKNNFISETKHSGLETRRTGNQHPLQYRMSRLNHLSKKTFQIYKDTKRRQYYLDANPDIREGLKKIGHLLKMIFGDELSPILKREISSFINSIAYDKAIMVISDVEYLKPKYDDIIDKAIAEYDN